MHEMSIAQSILDIVSDTLKDQSDCQLKEVIVQIGELTAVVPESLQFCYNVLTENTPYKDSVLKIKIIPLQGQCETCQSVFKIKNFQFTCPSCNSTAVKVLQGQELQISHLEVE